MMHCQICHSDYSYGHACGGTPTPCGASCTGNNSRYRDALQSIISHYDEQGGARSRGMDMILADCRKLLGTKT